MSKVELIEVIDRNNDDIFLNGIILIDRRRQVVNIYNDFDTYKNTGVEKYEIPFSEISMLFVNGINKTELICGKEINSLWDNK